MRLADLGSKANTLLANSLGDYLIQTNKRASKDKEDIGGIDLDEFLLRVFATALRWYRCLSPLNDLQQCLLHSFA